jgi:hypothetical protein
VQQRFLCEKNPLRSFSRTTRNRVRVNALHEPGFWNKPRMEDLFFHLEDPELDDLMEGYLIQDESCFATKNS